MSKLDPNQLFERTGLTSSYHDVTFEEEEVVVHPRHLATIDIELGDDEVYPLEVWQDDDPYLSAVKFCKRYDLNDVAIEIVQNKIKEVLLQDAKAPKPQQHQSRGTATKLIQSTPLSAYERSSVQRSVREEIYPFNIESHSKQDMSPHRRQNSRLSTNNKDRSVSPIRKTQPSQASKAAGTRLYQQGQRILHQLEQNRIKKKIQQEQEEDKQLTFKPQLNSVSERIVQIRKVAGQDISKAKKKQKTPQKIYQELESCTFKPQLNKVSQQIVRYKHANRDEQQRIDELYYDSIRQSQKRRDAEERSEFTHKPTLNQRSRSQVKTTFTQRLQKSISKKKADLSPILRKQIQEDCSFVPKVGRPPKIDRNKQNLPIGDYLLKASATRTSLLTAASKATLVVAPPKNRQSEAIYNNMINDRLTELFDNLDSDKDGLISAEHIHIQSLTANTLLFMSPLFKQLEDIEATLDERLFVKSMQKLLDATDPGTKGKFLSEKWFKDTTTQAQYSFVPEINQKSKKILDQNGVHRKSGNVSLYEQGIKRRKQLESRIHHEKSKKQEQQLQQCSFRPKLNSGSQVYMRKILNARIQTQST